MGLRFFLIICAVTTGAAAAQAQIHTNPHGQGRHPTGTHHLQRWHSPNSASHFRAGSNHGHGYVRNSGPRFNGPHRDW